MPDSSSQESASDRKSASPVSTGGGGVRLEHRLGAVFLTRMLVDGAISELGNHAPTLVAFQQAPATTVDDIVLTAEPRSGGPTFRLSVAVRRTPKFIKSHAKTTELVLALVRADIDASRSTDSSLEERLAIAVSGHQTHAREVAELAAVARNQVDSEEFFALINTPGKYATRDRLDHLKQMVSTALEEVDDEEAGEAEHRCWSLLSHLHIIEMHLDPADDAGWSALINDLKPTAIDHTVSSATALRDRLEQLAGEFAQSAGTISTPLLRRRLHGLIDPAAHVPIEGWDRLLSLDREARSLPRTLAGSGNREPLTLPRLDVREGLMASIASEGNLVVTGESGVGKSALVLDATEPSVLGDDHQALAINLRHLPNAPLQLLAALGNPVEDLLDEMTAPVRLLAIDGAEAASEGHGDVFRHLVRAAASRGVKIIAITATDGASLAVDLVKAESTAHQIFVVPPLTDVDVDLATEHFAELTRIGGDPKGRDLLRRPIVIELLARSGDPGAPVSQVDALAHVWKKLVRGSGPSAAVADAREQALMALASHQLTPAPSAQLLARLDHTAVEDLRRSGVLRAASELPWERVPEFTHDLLRTYALARNLLDNRDPVAVLRAVGAPRWTLPAARLACEVLLSVRDDPGYPLAGRFEMMQSSFDELASDGSGARWSDVPTEALLGIAAPLRILQDAWSYLLSDDGRGLERTLRVINLRHKRGALIDPLVAEPLVEQLIQADLPHRLGDAASDVITEWLQSNVLQQMPAGQATRIRLADSIVKRCADTERELDAWDDKAHAEASSRTPEEIKIENERQARLTPLLSLSGSADGSKRRRRSSTRRRTYEWIHENQIKHLALLGPDLSAEGEAILRRIGEDEPRHLEPAVESLLAGNSLAQFDTDLLIELAEMYYIEEDNGEEESLGLQYTGIYDDGVRRHRYWGLSSPMSAPYFGPFLAIFRADFAAGVAFLNRMLNHAASHRVRSMSRNRHGQSDPADLRDHRVQLSIDGAARSYVGDGQLWLWYRGTGVGPLPCMSALQALELVCDEFIAAGVPVSRVAAILLNGAESLAMPALVLGLLVRHLESVGEVIDPFIVEPDIWQLEFSRVVSDSFRGSTPPPQLVHPERRGWSLRETCMALNMWASGDRLERLRQLGADLIANATVQVGDDDSRAAQEHLASVRRWAATLDRSAYEMIEEGGQVLVQQKPDPLTDAILAGTNADLIKSNQAAGLTTRHAHSRSRGGRAPDLARDELDEDVAIAKSLLDEPPAMGLGTSPDGPVAVAATALELHFSGRAKVNVSHLEWAASVVLQVAEHLEARDPSGDFDDSFFDQAPDRSAGRSIVFLLLPAASATRATLGLDSPEGFERLIGLIRAVATAPPNETRLAFARSLDPLWLTPCESSVDGRCHHRIAFELVSESFRDSVLGPWDSAEQRRSAARLRGPDELANAAPGSILVRRLNPALRALGAAAITSGCCCTTEAQEVLGVLLDVHQRSMLEHGSGGFHSESDSLVAARAALWQAQAGRDEPLLKFIDDALADSWLLSESLGAIAKAAEEREDAASEAQRLWPIIMDRVLDAAEQAPELFTGDRGEYAESAVIPSAIMRDYFLTEERDGDPHPWRDLLAWTPQVERWIAAATQGRMSIDNLVLAVDELAPSAQVDTGLEWIEQIVAKSTRDCASTFMLPKWLHDRQIDLADGDQRARWQRVVDLLLVAGDTRVSDLAD